MRVIVGSGTARADDPLLTARPANLADMKRIATRIVVDSAATLSLESRLVQTAGDVPVLVAVGDEAAADILQATWRPPASRSFDVRGRLTNSASAHCSTNSAGGA